MFPKANFSFLNSQTGFVCGGQFDIVGMIWKTTDFGGNWLTYCVAPEPLKRIKVLSPGKIIAAGGDYEFGSSSVQSVDSGNSWIYDVIGSNDSNSFFGIGEALAFRTPREVWVPLAFGQAWGLSLDSGSKTSPWLYIPTPNLLSVYDAMFVTPSFGWACGYPGVLLQYNPEVIGIGSNNNVPLNSVLYQNYPNPFNPATTISYYLAKKSPVRITIFDITGRIVFLSNEGYQGEGMHRFKFSSSNLASGVYFYRIEAGDFIESKKMVILK
jgi:hypothetical protein